ANDHDAVSLPHPCVVPLTGAAFAAFYDGSGEFRAPDALPLSGEFEGEPYHIGLSLARAAANQSLFATYNSGAMCLQVDSEQVHVLTEGAFPLSAGTLDLLTEGKLRQFASPSAPAIVTVMPREPPTVRFGAGDDTEGLVQASWNNVEVSFYVLVYERFVRVFAVDADISASLSVYVDTTNETLRVAVADGPSVEGFSPTYNELLPDVAFDDVLESLVSLAFDSFLGDDLGFGFEVAGALEDALGVPLYIDFRGIEAVPATGSREFLNVYLALSDTPLDPLRARLPTDGVRLLGSFSRPVAGPGGAATLPAPEVRVVGLATRLEPTHEFFVQVDHGAWRGPLRPSSDGVLVVEDAKLRLVGGHHLRFRVRHHGAPTSLRDVEGALRVITDPVAPWVSRALDESHVVARGDDVGTAPSR
ncbi:MAG: hypothetical protein ACO3JL_21240, partial [Myxococcota bacterium]